jgi:hypothetical protein
MASVPRWFVNTLILAPAAVATVWIVAANDRILESLIGAVVVLTLAATLIGLNMQWQRRPALQVYYQAQRGGERNTLPRDKGIEVWLENTGRGVAEALNARFGTLGASRVLDVVSAEDLSAGTGRYGEYQWHGYAHVLNPGEELEMAILLPPGGHQGSRWISAPQQVEWWATAKGMPRAEGTIELKEPPNDG